MNFLLLFLFSSLAVGCYSAVYFERQPAVPGREKLCHDKGEGVFYKKGEEMKWKWKGCGRKICVGSNGKGHTYAEIQTCGKVSPPPEPCRIEVNLDAPYPHCCERITCPDEPDLSIGTNVH